MNKLREFKNSEFGSLGILIINGKEYFPASDCAKVLGYSNPRDAIARHCKRVVKRDGVSLTTNQHGVTTEQVVETNFIPEGDLYRLIIRSKLPAAERFERWVFDEVIPSIRKTGAYYGKRSSGRPRLNAPRDYIPKFWKGEQVVTLMDIASVFGMPRETIRRQANRRIGEFLDGETLVLIGEELVEFAVANGLPGYFGFGLRVFTERGFNRIARWPRGSGITSGVAWTWDAFQAVPHLPAPQAYAARLPALRSSALTIPAEQPASSLNVNELRKTLVALDVALDIYEHSAEERRRSESASAVSAIAAHFMQMSVSAIG